MNAFEAQLDKLDKKLARLADTFERLNARHDLALQALFAAKDWYDQIADTVTPGSPADKFREALEIYLHDCRRRPNDEMS